MLRGHGADEQDSAAFANGPWHWCPHHCPSLVAHVGYRWMVASDCAPPRPIDASGLRVGRCVCALPHVTAIEGAYPHADDSPPIYRGSVLADEDTPHGVGMHVATFHQTHSYVFDTPLAVRTVAMWHRGRQHGLVRRWGHDGVTVPPTFQFLEGVFRHDVESGPRTVAKANTAGIMVEVRHSVHGAGGRLRQTRARRFRDGRLFTLVSTDDPSVFDSCVRDVVGRVIYEGHMNDYYFGHGTGTLYNVETGRKVYEGTLVNDTCQKGLLFLSEDCHIRAIALDPTMPTRITRIEMDFGDAFAMARGAPDPVGDVSVTISSFQPGPDAAADFEAVPLARVCEWSLVDDPAARHVLDAESRRVNDCFACLGGALHRPRVCEKAAFFAWPRVGSALAAEAATDARGDIRCRASDPTPPDCVTTEHAWAFVRVMMRRHPHWARSRGTLYRALLPETDASPRP